MKSVIVELTPDGGVGMLHDDDVDLSLLGEISVKRASNVEWADGVSLTLTGRNGHAFLLPVGWYVQSAKTQIVLEYGFSTRLEALAWEKDYYSPGGQGWAELKESA